MGMATISADVTSQMIRWVDTKVKLGLYKSRSEVVREMFRSEMEKDENFMMSYDSLKKIWANEDDAYWESFLTNKKKVKNK